LAVGAMRVELMQDMGAIVGPHGSLLAVSTGDWTVRLWNPVAVGNLRILTGPVRGLGRMAFSPHGPVLATGTGRGTVRLRPLYATEGMAQSARPSAPVMAMASLARVSSARSGGARDVHELAAGVMPAVRPGAAERSAVMEPGGQGDDRGDDGGRGGPADDRARKPAASVAQLSDSAGGDALPCD